METMWKVLTRKKVLDPVSTEQSELGRVLNTLDLTALGVGSTLGVGVYVLAGHVAKDTAGPAVVLSFLIATIASVFAGLCYAEFGARTPRAGSAYIYSYVCVGEFIAFVIGWNLVLEYVIGSASVARGLSLYLDTLINNTLKNTFIEIAPINNVSFMSAYFDFFAFGISLLLAVALAFGLKESSLVNNIFTLVNLLVVVFVIIAGAVKADGKNWDLPANTTNSAIDHGGFFPFGVEGMIKGAATCFYGFVGFDCIATTGEEVQNPKKAIPISIVLSLCIIFLAYFGTSTVVTLMIPYYEQDRDAPLPHAFASVGMEWAKWVVAIGGIFGLCASLFGAMFPLPRIIYAMASDSIIFRFLGKVSSRFKTPVVGTLLAGLLTGLMAALFELKQLVNMMSIGTLLAYTIVAASVLLLRYTSEETEIIDDGFSSSNIFKQIFNCGRHQVPSETSEKLVKIEVCLYCVLCVAIGLCAMYLHKQIGDGEIWAIVITAVIVALTVVVLMSMVTQPKSTKELSFKVPLVPLIPALSILINIYLMLMLDQNTWIRFGVWMAVGLPTYYFSVKTHSDARNESIASRTSIVTNEKLNGYTNHSFDGEEIITEPKKRPAPQPPTTPTEIIADLDEMLENVEANLNDRKFSADSLSTNSYILHKENVKADVHCSDVPLTPATDVNPLFESSNVTYSNPASDISDVADSFYLANTEDESATMTNEPVAEVPNPPLSQEQSDIEEEKPEVTKQINTEENETIENEVTKQNDTESSIPEKIETLIPTKQAGDLTPPIPTPPPFLMQMDKTVNGNIPRPTVSALSTVKLKPVREKKPETPPVDYSDTDGNINFHSREYQEFKVKLGHQLFQGYAPLPPLPELKTPVAHNSHKENENVIRDSIDRNDVKVKLTAFLERTNSLPLQVIRDGKIPRKNDQTKPAEVTDTKDYQEQHRENMQNIFRSVRLRKEDSFKDKPTDVQNNNQGELNGFPPSILHNEVNPKRINGDNDRLEHKRNMDDAFKSIRLRKVDSFKQGESQ